MINQLIQRIQKTKAPISVGLDPMLGYIERHLMSLVRHWKAQRRPSGSLIKKSWTMSMTLFHL